MAEKVMLSEVEASCNQLKDSSAEVGMTSK